MGKLLDFLDLFRKGAAVTDPAIWKNRSALTLALTGLILVIVKVAGGMGYAIPIGETEAASIAAGVAVLVGLFSTYATSDKVGILPEKPVVQPDIQPAPDAGQPAPDSRAGGEPYSSERGY